MNRLLLFWKKTSFILIFIFLPIVALVDSRFGILALGCVLAPFLTSFFKGRYWCGNLCPRGSLFDVVGVKFSDHKKTPKLFQNVYFRIIVLLGTILYFINGFYTYGLDYNLLGIYFCKFILFTTFLSFALASFYNERTWCAICPAGTLAYLNPIKKKTGFKITDSCTSCHKCEEACLMNVSISNFKRSMNTSADCLKCGKCITTCPNQSILK